ncbi:MAG: SAM-dependent methyltransferase, partial [Bacillota bacterium]|nr:SAM-dependent methyltransferase [Bacillota bacterium]
ADIEAVLESVAAQVSPGGLFMFDFWHGPAVLSRRPEVRVRRYEDDTMKVTRIAEPIMRPDDNCVDVTYTIFVEDRVSGLVSQLSETHRMRYFLIPELKRWTQQMRWSLVSMSAGFSSAPLEPETWSGLAVVGLG